MEIERWVFVSCHSENYSFSHSAVLEASQAAMETPSHPQAAAHLNKRAGNSVLLPSSSTSGPAPIMLTVPDHVLYLSLV